jgi:hypothetical protein
MNFRNLSQKVTDMLSPPPVLRTREWLRENHPTYPKGVAGIELDETTNTVVVSLTDPLHAETLSVVAEAREFRTELDDSTEPRTLSIFTIEAVGDGVSRTQLVGTFDESRNQRLGLDPVTDYQTDPTLILLADYLSSTYPSPDE